LAFRECFDLTPSLGDPFVEWKQPAGETDTEIMIEPALECTTPRIIFTQKIDPFFGSRRS